MTDTRATFALVSLLVVAAAPALGQQAASKPGLCVSCSGPDATYRCQISGMTPQAAESFQGQVLCIKSLAAQGGHASCTVDRRVTDACAGEVRGVVAEGGASLAPAAPPSQQTAGALASDAPAEGTSPQPKQGPADAVKGGIAKVGNSINKAAGKTWDCVSSLFKNC